MLSIIESVEGQLWLRQSSWAKLRENLRETIADLHLAIELNHAEVIRFHSEKLRKIATEHLKEYPGF